MPARTRRVTPANLARPSSNVRDTVVMSATSPTPLHIGPERSWTFVDHVAPELPTAATLKAEFHPQPAPYNRAGLSRNGLTE